MYLLYFSKRKLRNTHGVNAVELDPKSKLMNTLNTANSEYCPLK